MAKRIIEKILEEGVVMMSDGEVVRVSVPLTCKAAKEVKGQNGYASILGCHCDTGLCPSFAPVGDCGSNATSCRFSNSVGLYGCPIL